MLTGDKLETAENIGKSCKLLSEGVEILRCSDLTLEGVKMRINEFK